MGIPALTQPKRTILPSGSGYDSTDPGGEGGGGVDPVPPALSGGDASLSYSISALEDGATLTIETDGTYDFGSVGPVLSLLLDATKVDAEGKIIPIVGEGSTLSAGYRWAVDDAAMPAGKGWRMGSTDNDTIDIEGHILRVSHAPAPRIFESRTYYWPESHRTASLPYLTEGANWQQKPIWNMADNDPTQTGTNFFLVSWQRWQDVFFATNHFISSNSIPSLNFSNSTLPSIGDIRLPLPEPLIMETLWDQGDVDTSLNSGTCETWTTSTLTGLIFRGERAGITLCEETASDPKRVVNGFTYPGYIKGFNASLGCNTIDADLYRAYGDGAACRVAICDSDDYFAATKRTILEPINWYADQLSLKLRNGWWSLTDLGEKYLCIIGADNSQIASVQIGGAE